MNSFKAFLREKGLYLLCLALVLIATVTGVMAVQTVVRNVKSLTDARQKPWRNRHGTNPTRLPTAPPRICPSPRRCLRLRLRPRRSLRRRRLCLHRAPVVLARVAMLASLPQRRRRRPRGRPGLARRCALSAGMSLC